MYFLSKETDSSIQSLNMVSSSDSCSLNFDNYTNYYPTTVNNQLQVYLETDPSAGTCDYAYHLGYVFQGDSVTTTPLTTNVPTL